MLQHDILIIGGGGAGLRAAIAAAETDPDLDIAIVSKVYPMRSPTVSAEGGAAAVIKPNDSPDDHLHDPPSGPAWLADPHAVEAVFPQKRGVALGNPPRAHRGLRVRGIRSDGGVEHEDEIGDAPGEGAADVLRKCQGDNAVPARKALRDPQAE